MIDFVMFYVKIVNSSLLQVTFIVRNRKCALIMQAMHHSY